MNIDKFLLNLIPAFNVLVKNYACTPADSDSLDAWVAEQSANHPGVDFSLFRDALDYTQEADVKVQGLLDANRVINP